jgi:hypothetical protein
MRAPFVGNCRTHTHLITAFKRPESFYKRFTAIAAYETKVNDLIAAVRRNDRVSDSF